MMRPSSSSSLLILVGVLGVIVSLKLVNAQFFDPKVNDNVYLDSIQNEVTRETEESSSDLMDEAKNIQRITKNYIGAQLKQNLFKALRVLAEKELDALRREGGPRQSRQEEEEEEEASTTRRPSNIFPQVASLLKAVFGGNVNLTSYVESATQLLPKPISMQIVGVVKLLANNPGYQYISTEAPATTPTTATSPSSSSRSRTTTPSTTPYYEEYDVKDTEINTTTIPTTRRIRRRSTTVAATEETTTKTNPTTTKVTTTPETTTEDEDEDEDEFSNPVGIFAKQNSGSQKVRQLPGLGILGTIGKYFAGGRSKTTTEGQDTTTDTTTSATTTPTTTVTTSSSSSVPVDTVESKRPVDTKTTVSSGFDEEDGMAINMSGIDLNQLIKEIQLGVRDLFSLPQDLFTGGAREGYKLLTSVTSLFLKLEKTEPVPVPS